MATALSINAIGVTQTGQPGPCTSVISFGKRSSRPLLTMVCVCPPQISMMVQGRVTFWRMAAASCSAAFGSRYSLRNFTELLFQSAHLFQVLEDALGFVLVNDTDGEPDVNQNIFADFGLGHVGEVNVLADAAKVDFAQTEGEVPSVDDFDQPARNGKTHERTSGKQVSKFQGFKVSTHHRLAQREAAVVGRDSLVRVHLKTARLEQGCRSLGQIAVLKDSAAEHDL